MNTIAHNVLLIILFPVSAFSTGNNATSPLQEAVVRNNFMKEYPGASIQKLECREFPEVVVTDCEIIYKFKDSPILYFTRWQYERFPGHTWTLTQKEKPLNNSRSEPLKKSWVKEQFSIANPQAAIDRVWIDQSVSGGPDFVISIDAATTFITYHLPPDKTPYEVSWRYEKQPDLSWTCTETSKPKDVTPHSLQGKEVKSIEFRWRGEDADLQTDSISITDPTIVSAFLKSIPKNTIERRDHSCCPKATIIFHTETGSVWAAFSGKSLGFYYTEKQLNISEEFVSLYEHHVEPIIKQIIAQQGAAPDADSGRR